MARKQKGKSELVLVAGGKPQMRKATPRDWTKEKEARFLSVLADTCNVTRAAEETGVSTAGAYKRRKENAAFRAGWLDAISVAYQRLELVLLDRAFNGTEKVVKRRSSWTSSSQAPWKRSREWLPQPARRRARAISSRRPLLENGRGKTIRLLPSRAAGGATFRRSTE